MGHEASLIATVALSFVLAFGCGFAAHWMRLPPLVGYIVAGIFMGPFTPGFDADLKMASQLAEMGIILLMFGVGLHFSAGDLMAVRWIAVPGALIEITVLTTIVTLVATAFGWSPGAAMILGLSLSVASTVVLLRALDERNLLSGPQGRIAVGWLVVEDLVMVLALVLLPTFAGVAAGAHGPGDGGGTLLDLALTLAKITGFVVMAVVLGPRVVPWLLKRVARTGSRELFTLSVLAVAMGIAYGSAELFGVSFALGAFFAGVVLSESDFSHRAAADSLPMQDAFAILFFVSVGLLFDPSILVREPGAVAAIVLFILFAKSLFACAVVLLLRFPPQTALTVGAGLAQIGEFSFILAALGIASGVLPKEGRDLILAGALLSITLNPLMFAAAMRLIAAGRRNARLSRWVEQYGRDRLAALEVDLEALRQRTEARQAQRRLQIQNLVERFPIFAALDHQAREDLLLLFRPRAAAPGERIIRKGDRGDTAFFISSGAVQVSVAGREIRLEPGEFFGEMALLSGARRSADVTAIDYCQFLTLDRRDFRTFLSKHPILRAEIDALAARRREMNEAEARVAAESAQ